MAYINAEKTAKIREELKKQFPSSQGWKLSLTNENHSSIHLSILAAPVRFSDKDYEQLNEYYLERYQNAEILKKMSGIMNGDFLTEGKNYCNDDTMTDYFDRGWYVNINQGAYNKPFVLVEQAAQETPNFEPVEVEPGTVQIIDYSEKAIAVIGDTRPIKDTLKSLGGRFNFRLSCGAGWIFPKNKLSELQTALTV